jgi:hypothetical protein
MCSSQSDSRGAAGDNGHFALQLTHDCSSVSDSISKRVRVHARKIVRLIGGPDQEPDHLQSFGISD